MNVPFYTWSRFTYRQAPEFCGNAVAGKEPETKDLIRGGNFDVQKLPGKEGVLAIGSEPCWIGRSPKHAVSLDREVFRTCGQSVRLDLPGGSDRLRQHIAGLEAGKKYRLAFFVKLANLHGDEAHPDAGFYVQIRFGTVRSDTVFRPIRQMFRGDVEWTRLEYTFTAPEGTGEKYKPYLEFRLAEGAIGKVWIDRVELVEVKE